MCWFWHKWTRWMEQCGEEESYEYFGGVIVTYSKRRWCKRCGKLQIKTRSELT